jgi:hypothetical protein
MKEEDLLEAPDMIIEEPNMLQLNTLVRYE